MLAVVVVVVVSVVIVALFVQEQNHAYFVVLYVIKRFDDFPVLILLNNANRVVFTCTI